MKTFVAISAILACASAAPGVLLGAPGLLASPLALARTVSVAAPAVVAPVAVGATSSQYHAQDELGQFSYGYAGGPSAKTELKTIDGVTRGGYNYIDANGVVQSVSYVSDANGFRVAATNLPVAPAVPAAPKLVGPSPVQDTPEVVAARAAHLAEIAKARSAVPAPAPVAVPVAVAAPVAVVAAPQPVQDTPEVAAAKIAHAEAHKNAAIAAALSPA